MALSFLKGLFSFSVYSRFCFKIDDITNGLSKNINHKIKNISGNVSLMPFKLGTSNIRQVRYKMTPTVVLPWRQFGFSVYFMRDSLSQFLC